MPTALAPRHPLFSAPNPAPATPTADTARVWIVMRTRARPLLLRRAIASVLSQSLPAWHLCIVNDGGAPEPVEQILAEHAAIFAGRVSLRHNAQSRGMEAASNLGLAHLAAARPRAPYFAIHDDDDSWHPDFLRRTVASLDDPAHADFIGTATRATVINERIEDDAIIEESRQDFPFRPGLADLAALLMENRFPPIALLLRTRLLDEIGGFNPALPVLGDWEFNIRAALAGDILALDAPLAYYHHRHAPGQAAYGNTVTTGQARHEFWNARLRNSLLREGVKTRPDLLGLLQPLLHTALQTERAMQAAKAERDALAREMQAARAELHAMHATLAALRADMAALRAQTRPGGA